jgi:hypothetical protein
METQIVPINSLIDIDSLNMQEKKCFIGIEEVRITYIQPADTLSSEEDVQTITLTSRNAVSANLEDAKSKKGFYIDISIPQGQHWSVDSPEEFTALIEDFYSRLYKGVELLPNEIKDEFKPKYDL